MYGKEADMSGSTFQNSNIDMLLMRILKEKDMYGYELIQKIKQMSDSRIVLKTGTIYPILHSLEREGYIHSYERSTDAGLTRKYYKITENGEIFLQQKIKDWKEYTAIIDFVLEG